MALESTNNRITYVGDDLTTVFPYNFKIFVNTDLTVTEVLISTGAETVLTITTDYTVSNVGNDNGGNVTLLVALASTKKLVIRRVLALIQTLDLEENDNAPSGSQENRWDKNVMMIQQLQEQLDRVVLQGILATSPLVLPNPVTGLALVWDANGDIVNSALNTIPTSTVSDGSITTLKLADLAVTIAKIANLAVTAAKLATDAVETAKIKDLAVTTAKIAADAIDSTKIEDDAVRKEHLNVDVVNAGSGLVQEANGSLSVDPSDTNPALENADGGLRVKVDNVTIERTASGIAIKSGEVTRAWINFDGTGVIAINDSFNVSGIVDNGVGDYTVTWDTDFADVNYAIAGFASDNRQAVVCGDNSSPLSAGNVVINIRRSTNDDTGVLLDCDVVTIIAIGNQ